VQPETGSYVDTDTGLTRDDDRPEPFVQKCMTSGCGVVEPMLHR
jgi:hypothetical protein